MTAYMTRLLFALVQILHLSHNAILIMCSYKYSIKILHGLMECVWQFRDDVL